MERRKIEELIALYEFEPELRDIFVEGVTDQAFFTWYCRRKEMREIRVYSIDVIDVPDSVIDAHGLPRGCNRARVVALAKELHKSRPTDRGVMCIVDRDSNAAVSERQSNPLLFLTDGSDLEMYTFTPHILEKFVLVCLGGFSWTATKLIDQMTNILKDLYIFRNANVKLSWGMEWLDFDRYIVVDVNNLKFRRNEFVRAYLQKNLRHHHAGDFQRACDELEQSLDSDPRRFIRGHDFSLLFAVVLRKLKKTRIFGNSVTVEGCLLAALEMQDVDKEPLFSAIGEFGQIST